MDHGVTLPSYLKEAPFFVVGLNTVVDRLNEVWWEERWNVLLYADDALLIGRTEKDIVSKVNVYKPSIVCWA